MFGIWAEVWGGVTGHRCAWLKADGVIQQYQTREEAEAEATRLAREHNGNPPGRRVSATARVRCPRVDRRALVADDTAAPKGSRKAIQSRPQ